MHQRNSIHAFITMRIASERSIWSKKGEALLIKIKLLALKDPLFEAMASLRTCARTHLDAPGLLQGGTVSSLAFALDQSWARTCVASMSTIASISRQSPVGIPVRSITGKSSVTLPHSWCTPLGKGLPPCKLDRGELEFCACSHGIAGASKADGTQKWFRSAVHKVYQGSATGRMQHPLIGMPLETAHDPRTVIKESSTMSACLQERTKGTFCCRRE